MWELKMQGDFSRWTFDKTARYRSVLLQQGRVLLDADWNEQTEITAHHDETRAFDTFGPSGVPLAEKDSFRITDETGNDPNGKPWKDLRITCGRMYVDGVLVETLREPTYIPLGDQPDLAAVVTAEGVKEDGLPEPATDGRWAFYLDAHPHHVTVDEVAGLRESALGGPDTSTRTRTAWQVKYREIKEGTTCPNLHEPGWLDLVRGTMAASLTDPEPTGNPCDITTAGSYTRLENQLYRVQVHKTGENFLWSRENGSVTASLRGVETANLPAGVHAVLTVDRVGRDEDLSIGHDDVVEVTSTTRQLAGDPGYLAKVVNPDGLRLPVVWLGGAASGVKTLEPLGTAPIVRRWESEPVAITTAKIPLEDGIRVEFKDKANLRTGDYWLIPARSARLAYGLTAASGSLEWPEEANSAAHLEPYGPTRHVAPLAILKRVTTGGVGTWTLESDCRLVAPSLTQLTTIDLIGGDGQESMPGTELPGAIRVVVRNGNVPVPGARVRFTPEGGTVRTQSGASPIASDGSTFTDEAGVAKVWWTLDPTGAQTQTLEVQRLDGGGAAIDVKVVVTGRLSLAQDVAWIPPQGCAAFDEPTNVQKALEGIVQARELRLLGGDGQQPAQDGILPQLVRVIVDSTCGPVKGAKVNAEAAPGALVKAAPPGGARPGALTGASRKARALTEPDGSAAFWWQPNLTASEADTLTLHQEGDANRAPVIVSAQAGRSPAQTDGIHITKVSCAGQPFPNDHRISVQELSSGITVELDKAINTDSVRDKSALGEFPPTRQKPTVRVILDIPYEGREGVVGSVPLTLEAELDATSRSITWKPLDRTANWLASTIPDYVKSLGREVSGRFQIDGWAIVSESKPRQHLNGHADALVAEDRPIDFWHRTEFSRATEGAPLTDDAVTGGRYEQWFWLWQKEA
ncbi:DUF6519 domain-containing protein [Streptomyces sp. NPDC048551]|uniref:DUF6519 domain-containing protein n=1 Tax=Streptomyces sp. NPDC048551 TaxID=3155758 RepID=UPI00344457A9